MDEHYACVANDGRFGDTAVSADEAGPAPAQALLAAGLAYFGRLEGVDREHVADALLRLRERVTDEAVVSVRAAPSDPGRCVTLAPIATWTALLEAAGFDVEMWRSPAPATNDDSELETFTSLHWRRVDPFREEAVEPWFLRLRKTRAGLSADALRTETALRLDIGYRADKRAGGPAPSTIVYAVHLIQDWPFLRSLMDVWPADRLRVLFRKDLIAPRFLEAMEARCRLAGAQYASVSRADVAALTLEGWFLPQGSAFLTATEGVRSPLHKTASLLAMEAAKSMRTVCLQHGALIGRTMIPASQVFAAWDRESADAVALAADSSGVDVRVVGSIKFQDALATHPADGLANRLGDWTRTFSRRILVGLNLHWAVHAHDAEATAAWLERLTNGNPDTLFLLRPHPDDASIHDRAELLARPNVLLLDEMLLFALDAAIARIVGEVDGVITTASTLVLDAVAAGRPVVVLPTDETYGDPKHFLQVARGYLRDSVPALSDADWTSGALPPALATPVRPGPAFDASRGAVAELLRVASEPYDPSAFQREGRYGNIAEAFLALDFDQRPHGDLARVAAALDRFVVGTSGRAGRQAASILDSDSP